MKKIIYLAGIFLLFTACKNDDGADHGGVLWNLLCGDHVLLPLSGAGDAGRKISRVADPFKLLGL